jgi:hypothetical protein
VQIGRNALSAREHDGSNQRPIHLGREGGLALSLFAYSQLTKKIFLKPNASLTKARIAKATSTKSSKREPAEYYESACRSDPEYRHSRVGTPHPHQSHIQINGGVPFIS